MPGKKRTNKDYIFLFFKGIAMGAANKVPGVSGGIVAFVVGFYEEFIYSLQKFNAKALKLLLSGRWNSFFNYINASFLGFLILGTIVSYFSVSKLLDILLQRYELYVWAWFFGMIIGSIYYMYQSFQFQNKKYYLFILAGILVGAGISFLEPATENDQLMFVFLCGFISVSGMTLPGLSGSFILILIGNYVLLLVDAVNALFDTIVDISNLDFSFVDDSGRIRLLQVLGMFTLGSVVGLISISHVLGFVLKRFRTETYALLIGFIAGSLGVVWPWKNTLYERDELGNLIYDANNRPIIEYYHRYLPDLKDLQNWWAIFYIIIGISLLLLLAKYKNKTLNNA